MLDRLHTELQHVPLAIENQPTATMAGTNSKLSKNYICPPLATGKARGQSIVTNVFGGILQSEVRCLVCGMESKKHDPFLGKSRYFKGLLGDSRESSFISRESPHYFEENPLISQ